MTADVGTLAYMAPEVSHYLMGTTRTEYDGKADVFSTGCVFYYLLVRAAPVVVTMASDHSRRFPAWRAFVQSDESLNHNGLLLTALTNYDPELRSTAAEVLAGFFTA